jgi:two-component system sensor histidine kinase DegS
MSLDDLGLIVTVERYARQVMETQEIQVTVQHNTEEKVILPVINLTLFRIIQEACCNIIKHAKASIIEINIEYQENDILISIKDNGIGFDLEMQKKKSLGKASGFGLSIMKERTSLLSGTLKIHSENGKGTIVTIWAPITKCEGEKNE